LSKPSDRKTEQFNVRINADLYARFDKVARRESRKHGELARMILEAVIDEVEAAGSLAQFMQREPGPPRYSPRVSHVTQDQVRTALGIIFQHAPSPVIERVVEFISERAARYEGENNNVRK
jgi:predicted DNA-binding protein